MFNISDLKEKGVSIVENVNSRSELIALAEQLGEIKPHPNGEKVALLKSSDGVGAPCGTLSNNFGLLEFPFHTDTAFWGVPARYVVMGMFKKSKCTTNYISIDDIAGLFAGDFYKKANNSIYLSQTFEEKKYTSPLFANNGVSGFRFDPNIMLPVNDVAKFFHEELLSIIKKIKPTEMHWDGNKAIIFDNWSFLHSRSPVINEDREIFRIYVEQ